MTRNFNKDFMLLLAVVLNSFKGTTLDNCSLVSSRNSSLTSLISDDVKIVQLDLLNDDFDHTKSANEEVSLISQTVCANSTNQVSWFKPSRWFLIRGERTDRLLLLFYYYYGMFESFLYVERETITFPVSQAPPKCLNAVSSEQKYTMVRDWLIKSTKALEDSSVVQVNELCTMFVKNELGFGVVQYKCCNLDDVECHYVVEDEWVWSLRIFITLVTIFVFYYLPNFLPRAYSRRTFTLIPSTSMTFRFVKTKQPSKYIVREEKIPYAIFKNMLKLQTKLKHVQADILYKATVKEVDFLLQREQILSETDQSASLLRLLYDSIIRCKIRHVDSLETCCQAAVCGNRVSRSNRCPRWVECLTVIKTILIYFVIFLPAVPLLYSICTNDLPYVELAEYMHALGLLQTSSFYLGSVWGKVLAAVLTTLYIVHVVMVIFVDSKQEEMAQTLEGWQNEQQTRNATVLNSVFRTIIHAFKQYGVFILPIIAMAIIISPILVFFYLIVTSPVIRMMTGQCRSKTKLGPCGKTKLLSWFLTFTLLDVFVVVTIATNFVLHLLCISIINILINLNTSMSIVSLVVLLLVYIRDTTNRLAGKYNKYHRTLLGLVLASKQGEVTEVASKCSTEQRNSAFQHTRDSEIKTTTGSRRTPRNTIWKIKDSSLRMRTDGLTLFLDKYDVPYIPLKFFNEMTEVNCCGCPGPLQSSIMDALKDLAKVVLFLLFLFILILAYGDTVYISPSNKLFATIATGLIPLALRSFFSRKSEPSLDTSSLKFQNIFKEKLVNFSKKWHVKDFDVDIEFLPTKEFETYVYALWNHPTTTEGQKVERPEVDLLFDLNRDVNKENVGLCGDCCFNGVDHA